MLRWYGLRKLDLTMKSLDLPLRESLHGFSQEEKGDKTKIWRF